MPRGNLQSIDILTYLDGNEIPNLDTKIQQRKWNMVEFFDEQVGKKYKDGGNDEDKVSRKCLDRMMRLKMKKDKDKDGGERKWEKERMKTEYLR